MAFSAGIMCFPWVVVDLGQMYLPNIMHVVI